MQLARRFHNQVCHRRHQFHWSWRGQERVRWNFFIDGATGSFPTSNRRQKLIDLFTGLLFKKEKLSPIGLCSIFLHKYKHFWFLSHFFVISQQNVCVRFKVPWLVVVCLWFARNSAVAALKLRTWHIFWASSSLPVARLWWPSQTPLSLPPCSLPSTRGRQRH